MEKTVLVGGLPIQVSDKDALIVQRELTQLQDQVENFKKKFSKQAAEEEEEAAEDAKRVEDSKTKDALMTH